MANFTICLIPMRLYLIAIFILIAVSTLAQKVTLSGKVIDKSDGEPLSLASIVIKGKAIGTVANFDGYFDFHFAAEFRGEMIVVSMIGYENFESPAWALLDQRDKPLTIELVRSTTLLGEVVVMDSLSGGEIFRVAMSRISQNCPMQPFLLDGFYRDVKKINDTYIALLEAAVKIYDDNYEEPRNKEKLRERVKLVEVRKSLGYENKFTSFFGQQNLLGDLLLHNNIRYRQIETSDDFFASVNREADSHYNGREMYVLSQNQGYNLKVFIDKEDFSIVHLEFETQHTGNNLARRKELVNRAIGYKKIIDFRRIEGKMFLNYITMTSKESWYDAASNTLQFETELIQDLLINEVHPHPDERIGPTEKMRGYGLQYQDYPYNKKFWDEYNVIKETPLDIQIRTDLEKEAPLEKQFEN
jgi:hypothetical protein